MLRKRKLVHWVALLVGPFTPFEIGDSGELKIRQSPLWDLSMGFYPTQVGNSLNSIHWISVTQNLRTGVVTR